MRMWLQWAQQRWHPRLPLRLRLQLKVFLASAAHRLSQAHLRLRSKAKPIQSRARPSSKKNQTSERKDKWHQLTVRHESPALFILFFLLPFHAPNLCFSHSALLFLFAASQPLFSLALFATLPVVALAMACCPPIVQLAIAHASMAILALSSFLPPHVHNALSLAAADSSFGDPAG
jgi:hypothetical protein